MSDVVTCSGCGRRIEICAFCDDEGCTSCICYRCLLFELDEARPAVPRDEADT